MRKWIPAFLIVLMSCAGNPHRSAVRIYLQEQNAEKAIEEGKKWVETDPQNAEAFLWLGVSYAIAKDYEKAGDNFFRALLMDSTLRDTALMKRIFTVGGAPLFSPQAVVTTLQNSASLRSKSGDYEKALKHFDIALKVDPANPSLYLLKAGIYEKMGNEDSARGVLEAGYKKKVLSKEGLYFLGEMYLSVGRLDDAVQVFQDAISKDPEYDKALYGLGVTYFKQEKLDSSRAALLRATSLNPENADAWYNLGIVELKMKDYASACKSMRQYVSLRPQDVSAWFLLAAALYDTGKLDEALGAVEHCLTLDPENIDAWNYKGLILKKMGKTEEALKAFQRAAQLEKKQGK